MSQPAMTYCLQHSAATGQSFRLLMNLADCCHGHDPVCWPGIDWLQQRMGIRSKQGVVRLLTELKNRGEISVLKERKGRLRIYKLTRYAAAIGFPKDNTCVVLGGDSEDNTGVVLGDSQGQQNGCAEDNKSVAQGQQNGCAEDNKSVVHRNSKEQWNGEEPPPPRNRPPVELSDRFPRSESEAIAWTMGQIPDEGFIRQWWHEAAGAGGCDPYTLKPVTNWAYWIAAKWHRHGSRNGESRRPQKKGGDSLARLEFQRDQLAAQLAQMPGRPGSPFMPTPEQEAAYRTAKAQERDLLARIAELRHPELAA